MSKNSHQRFGIASLCIALVGTVAFANMIWTIAEDIALANVLWPNDIHRHFVALLGGHTTMSPGGVAQHSVGWLDVFGRVAVCLISLSGISSVFGGGLGQLRSRRTKLAEQKHQRSGWLRRFIEDACSLASPLIASVVWLTIWYVAPVISGDAFLSFFLTTTPLWLAMIVAIPVGRFVGMLCSRDNGEVASPAVPSLRSRLLSPEFLVVLAALLTWEATSFWMNERLYAGLLVPHGDSAMYEEHLWNVWHGKGFRSYLDQGLFLGEHIQVIHLLLLPLHMLWPSYLMMELCASCSLAICAVPIFSIAQRHSGSSRAAMWLALAWLFFFPMHFLDIAIDIKTLRPSCYGLPFLFWGIDFAERRRLLRSSICLLIALSTQEDFSMIVGSIGLVFFLTTWMKPPGTGLADTRRMRIWSGGVLLFSVAYLLLAVLVVIPAFRGGDVVHYSRYFGDLGSSPGDLVRTAITEPMKVLSVLVSFRTLGYLLVLTVPLGLLTWRKPVYLLAGVPTFVMLSLIQLGNDPGPNVSTAADTAEAANQSSAVVSQLPPVPYHHFHAPLLPVIFWAAAAGLHAKFRRAQSESRRRFANAFGRTTDTGLSIAVARARFAFFCALGTAVTGSMMPMGANFWSVESAYGRNHLYVPGPRAVEFLEVLAMLPESSRVASTDYVHTRLTHFERSYDYSGYPRAINNYQPGVPADTDYIVIDTSHPYSAVRSLDQVRELKTEPEQWEVLPDTTDGLFIVLKRRRSEALRIQAEAPASE
jgi:hypothetical protein